MLHPVTSDQARLLRVLFPHLDGLEFERVEDSSGSLQIMAWTETELAVCPQCATSTARPLSSNQSVSGGSGLTSVDLPPSSGPMRVGSDMAAD
ncbi:hypothetical protein [Nonomuraea solani]|uniref:hypothetical protein n=1 Tax=Nonomuraea solani TaxID=1144553 RepID=UPI000CDE7535|nr:hypothetical protein [Nonomuraea solani]